MNKYAKNDPYVLTTNEIMEVNHPKRLILDELERLDNYTLNLQLKLTSKNLDMDMVPIIKKELKYRYSQIKRLQNLLELNNYEE